ncbi:hypothetical protein E2F48_00980 [Arthrobacter crusticola]|uniref:Uncharacterized protein n=1 Tax=Arthrobacter crusticola TaxID=2547960 RepID=A0A4R5U262_9MICC|nr:hypothetical protein [Arthrobacter crusticola]TDK27739.1 hypothetical protein E2F48_00980 [Arthrobacter crusticola]
MSTPAGFRFLRSSVVASLILLLSTSSHLIGGGTLPEPAILLLLAALVLAAVTSVSGRPLSFPALAGVLLAGELALHTALTALTGGSACAGASAAQHHAPAAVDCQPLTGQLTESAEPGGTLMLVAHAVAAVILALLISKGEAALDLLAAWLRPLAGMLEASAVVPPLTRGSVCAQPVPRLRRRDASVPPLRGPPAAAALPLLPA